ncbi:MAG: TRAP transporter small permease [Eubacteriales bacterium]|nr:TRAP transporter small permease [Eubacteriales bacterium]
MRKFYDFIYWLFMTFCKLVFIASIIITSYVVFNRYVLSKTPRWGEQAILLCMVYMALISASLAIRTDRHIRVVLIQYLFPASIREKAMSILHGLSQICITAFSIFMIIYGYQFTMLMTKSKMSGLGIANSYLYAAVPVAGICMLIMQSERLIYFISKLMGKTIPGYENGIVPPEELVPTDETGKEETA